MANNQTAKLNKIMKPIPGWVTAVLGIVYIITTFIAFKAFLTPADNVETKINNSISQNTVFDYKATVTPNTLYPDGGTIEPGKSIFTNITSSIPVNIKTSIQSDNPIEAEGTKEIVLSISSGDLWEKEFPLKPAESFSLTGKDLSIVDGKYIIDLDKVSNFIETVESETKISNSSYMVSIKPKFEGFLTYKDNQYEFKNDALLSFEYTKEKISLMNENGLEYVNNSNVEDNIVTDTRFQILGIDAPLEIVRWASTFLSILLLIVLGLIYFSKKTGSGSHEAESIDKKFKSRIINVSEELDLSGKTKIPLTAFKDLIQISEERELPVFKQESQSFLHFFVLENDFCFIYMVKTTE
ncbi:DUF5305 family protein [Mesobacillus subterraneus]|uniref:DUF5305 family protein n=1 Tax=Mesobacillus subterraneus TaxID=285983 RepID=UPI001CFEF7A7|nr:DUF5305 family protein [Mesobacillus subterraneus]WLR55491.1 DUF5305 family protein [Mesobacillus subterraneus]